MKYKPSILSKHLLVLASIILMVSIVMDVLIVYPQLKDRCLVDDYVDFEKQNIREHQRACIKRIHNTIAFRTPGWGKYFQAFTSLESKSIATLENDLIILLDPEINSLDELGYEAEDIRDARKRMLKSNDEDIKSIYEMLLFSAMLELLEINVSRYPCIMFMTSFELIRPITEDSTYLGGLAYDSERSKNAYRINGKYFQPQHDDYYQFPAADTIHIQTLDIINEGSHIDTLITTQTITKVDGRWWNIGGRKEGA